jgi:hypothetical protein
MRRKNLSSTTEQLDPDLLNHISGLGLSTVKDYRDWCGRNGFSRKLKKHWKQRCRERSLSQLDVAQQRLERRKHEQRNHANVLQAVCSGELTENDVTQPHLKRLCEVVRPDRSQKYERQANRKTLTRLLTHLHQCRAKFFDGAPAVASLGPLPGNTYVEALVLVATHAPSWQRQIEEWKPCTHSESRQFASLLRHLFVLYDDVPSFFDAVWFSGRGQEAAERRKWFLHVGRGLNIGKCKMPIPFTKKMAHHLMHAPNDVTIDQAIRWGQVHGLDGDERLARAIFGTRLGESFRHDEFWSTVIRWFASHPMLDRAHVGSIVDFIHYQRFIAEQEYVAPGRQEVAASSQPNLTMKGRTPDGLLHQVNAWHRTLANDNRHQIRQWPSSSLAGFEFVEGSQQSRNLKCWTIRELLSTNALITEGRQMRHCVATYASSCIHHRCSIWTMEVESNTEVTKAVTIEVRNNARQICQIRGKSNRSPTDKERKMIQRWADAADLQVASYA